MKKTLKDKGETTTSEPSTKRGGDFPEKVSRVIAQRAMFICSSPDCYRLTGYGTTDGKVRSVAEAAHMIAASTRGPRADRSATVMRKAADNGIWLCKICHTKIDNDPVQYTLEMLREWKKAHEDVIRRIVGKDLEAALLSLKNARQYHQQSRELVSFLENKRVFYEAMDNERPSLVLDSLSLIRERLIAVRANVDPESNVFLAMNQLQRAIDTFLRDIGASTNMRTLKCNASDPNWRRFSKELLQFRAGMIIIIKVIAGNADYKLTWF
ncbi:MAG: hypothetical protein H7144_15845 [Burkholderiales bacterium]|nr:hypothetical protein [Phycisphaerae bacterium]